ncbi:MAG: diguanylate cyclase [Clostridia bacterium]|nr:diguanylate cyclase [Clostridia bacterium]
MKRIFVFVAIILVAVAVFAFLSFYIATRNKAFDRLEAAIEGNTEDSARMLEGGISEKENMLARMASLLAESGNIFTEENFRSLDENAEQYGFSNILMSGSGGITFGEGVENALQAEVFAQVMAGESVITDLTGNPDGNFISINVPIAGNGEVFGVLSASVTAESLIEEYCGRLLYQDEKKILVGKNFKEIVGAAIMSRIKEDIDNGLAGKVRYNYGGTSTYYYYAPLKNYDMYLLNSFPQSFFDDEVFLDCAIALKLLIEILLVLAVFVFWLLRKERTHTAKMKELFQNIDAIADNVPGGIITYSVSSGDIHYISNGCLQMFNMREREFRVYSENKIENIIFVKDRADTMMKIRAQAEKSDTIDVFYRIETSDKEMFWVRHIAKFIRRADGSEEYCAVLNDVTQQHNMEQELRVREARFNMVVENTNTTVFEWKVGDDLLIFPCNYMEMLGVENKYVRFLARRQMSDVLYEEDREEFFGAFEELKNGADSIRCDFRIQHGGKTVWFALSAKTLFNEDGISARVIGSIVNIDADRKRMEMFKEKSLRDAFSGLYNKDATKMLIDSAFAEYHEYGERHALVVIDLDNFKAINDTIGHLAGDEVLKNTARRLIHAFRSEDIVGRIGGDEFVVLMKYIPDDESVIWKISQLLHDLTQETMAPDGRVITVTASIGVAFYPDDGATYETVFAKSDSALYSVKKSTKNGYNIYKEK